MRAMSSQVQKSIIDWGFGCSIIIFVLSIWVGCSQRFADPEADLDPAIKSPRVYTQDELQALFGGNSGLEVLATATKVRAYRVKELRDQQEKGAEKIFHHTITSELREVDAATAKELVAILGDRTTYHDFPLECTFDPAVGFRFENESERIDVLVCFACQQILVVPPEKFADFGSRRLLEIAKKLFPDDTVIQAIGRKL